MDDHTLKDFCVKNYTRYSVSSRTLFRTCSIEHYFQNAAKYLLSEKSHCTDRLATFKALIIFHNNGVKIDTSQTESNDSDEKVEEKGKYGVGRFTRKLSNSVLGFQGHKRSILRFRWYFGGAGINYDWNHRSNRYRKEWKRSRKYRDYWDTPTKSRGEYLYLVIMIEKTRNFQLSQHLQLMLQQQLVNYHLALQQNLQNSSSSSAGVLRGTSGSTVMVFDTLLRQLRNLVYGIV